MQNKFKSIYFVVHDYSSNSRGGVNRMVSETANKLSEKYNVNIVSLGEVKETSFQINPKVKLHSLSMKKHSTTQYFGLLKGLWLIKSFINILKFYNGIKEPSIWNVTSPPLIILFLFLSKRGNKFIYCEHTSLSKGEDKFFYKLFRRVILNHANLTISLNEKDQKKYKEMGVKSKLIYNGIVFPNKEIKQKERIIVFVGRFSKEKDPLSALRIFYASKLWEEGYKFKMYGWGELLPEVIKKIEEYRLNEHVEVILNENNPKNIYRGARCLIMTSKFEGFGLVLIEAMSRGVPCISFDCPNGPADIIKNGVNGYLVNQNDIKQYIIYLNNVIKNDLNSEIIVNSVSKFNIEAVAKEWDKLFFDFSGR